MTARTSSRAGGAAGTPRRVAKHHADPGAEDEPGDDVGPQQPGRSRGGEHGADRSHTGQAGDRCQSEDQRIQTHVAMLNEPDGSGLTQGRLP
jgi:hypothetical protein